MSNFYENTADSQDVLTEFEVNLVQASAGRRFANYIIDLITWCILIFVFAIIYYLLTGVSDGSDDDNPLGTPLERLLFALIFAISMGLIEAVFKGKTLGKLITGTRAVNLDGTRISAKTAFLRGLSRIVPFEPFSALGSPSHPWHDRWTDTLVVDEKASTLPLIS